MIEQLGGVVVGAMLTLAAGLLQHWYTERHAHDREMRRVEREDRNERRAAYIALIQGIDELKSRADGANMSGRTLDTAAIDFPQVAATAEFYAPAETWARIEPCVRALAYMVNGLTPAGREGAIRDIVRTELAEMGADTHEGWMRLRGEVLDATRADILRR